MFALEIKELKKSYRKPFSRREFLALRGVSFSVSQGTIFGLIGPNGAGKTTTIKSIINLVRPSYGSILISGRDSRRKEARREIGYMPETEKYPTFLTGRQFLEIFFRFSGKELKGCNESLYKWIEMTGLSDAIDKSIAVYSKGMRKKLGLIQAILHEPKLLLLDEPIEGLDAIGKKIVFDSLKRYCERGNTILINSHYLSEVEKFCDRVAIINQGQIVMELDPKCIHAPSGYLIGVTDPCLNYTELLSNNFPVRIEKPGSLLFYSDDEELLNRLIHYLCENKISINRVEKIKTNLEEAYLSVVQNHKTLE
ncbi:MAG: ABC transporter ATP-binding protein [Candidatus Scalindua sp.]|nr:ABC transporter ATP-binding protein [Candidatus Scalindua sp.]